LSTARAADLNGDGLADIIAMQSPASANAVDVELKTDDAGCQEARRTIVGIQKH
jgi:hypothetical protein